MRKQVMLLALTFVGLAAFAVFAGWAFYEGASIGGGWRSLGPIWPYVVGGCAVVAGLAGLLMWLAFYSARHGYDDRYDGDDY